MLNDLWSLKSDTVLYPHKVSWVKQLQQLLSSSGFYKVLLAHGVGNVNTCVRVFKQRLRDINVQNWNSRIENSTGSTCFASIVSYSFQFYLECNINSILTAALSRLLLSSHNHFIETGRWHRSHCIPHEDLLTYEKDIYF